MGRLAVLDNSVETNVLNVSESWNLGLLVGCVSEQRDYVVHFANTPIEEEVKKKSISAISDILVTSHASELQRMLPGGLCICGVAAIGADLTSCQTKLQQIMTAAYKKVCLADKYGNQTETWHLLLVDSITKKISSRSLLVSDYKSSLKPSEVRFQSLQSGWLIAETSVALDRTFYLHLNQQNQHFEQQLTTGLSPYLETIAGSLCLYNGKRIEEDEQLGLPEGGKGKKSTPQNTAPSHINIQLLGRSEAPSSSKCDEMVSSVWLKGTVSAIAFLRSPDTAGRVAEAIKSDLKKSIIQRCQLLCEDILQVGSEKHTLDDQMIYETPPRVYIPHGSVPVVFNDYMFKDEKVEDCSERAQQILGIEHIDSASIDTSVERSAKMADIDYLHSLEEDDSDSIGEAELPRSLMGSFGKIASIASGAAIALAVSLSYLNVEEWFG